MHETRVMTLAVVDKDIPWSSPVYFVCHNNGFYFFSNEHSRHIQCAKDQNIISASIFQDSDQIDEIFGFQMSGMLERVSRLSLYLQVVKKYVTKFSFLKQVFGRQIIDNKNFFLEKFKSHLYCFQANDIFMSDNSRTTEKRIKIDLTHISWQSLIDSGMPYQWEKKSVSSGKARGHWLWELP